MYQIGSPNMHQATVLLQKPPPPPQIQHWKARAIHWYILDSSKTSEGSAAYQLAKSILLCLWEQKAAPGFAHRHCFYDHPETETMRCTVHIDFPGHYVVYRVVHTAISYRRCRKDCSCSQDRQSCPFHFIGVCELGVLSGAKVHRMLMSTRSRPRKRSQCSARFASKAKTCLQNLSCSPIRPINRNECTSYQASTDRAGGASTSMSPMPSSSSSSLSESPATS